MSTAQLVPETWDLDGEDARRTLGRTGRRRLLVDAFKRLRVADGFSHARSLAFMTSLVMVQGLIAIVGFASLLGKEGVSGVIVRTIQSAAPGPAGRLLTETVVQAQRNGSSHRITAVAFGCVGALIAATTAFGQLERAFNRIYGIEQDRPTGKKYAFALLLAVSAGLLEACAFATLAFGHAIGNSLNDDTVSRIWNAARCLLLGLALTIAAMTMLLRWCPRRRQPSPSWLAFGAAVSVVLWAGVTVGLALFFRASSSFGSTYGPLAGMVALLLWALLSAVAVLYGAAVAAQLEAVRAGAGAPQDQVKVAESEPEAAPAADHNELAGSLAVMTAPTVEHDDVPGRESDPVTRIRRTLEGVIGVAATEGNRIEVLLNGDRIFAAMLDAIGAAEHTIDFLTFVYWDGEIGTQFAKALAARASKGVRVRLLLDGFGAHALDKTLIADMERAGVTLRWFRPLARFRPGRVIHRTHRKVVIIDEEVAFTGGVGIADEWKGDARNENEWRDTHFRIDGPAVDGLRAAFLADWAETRLDLFEAGVDRFPEQEQPGDAIVQCVRGAAGPGQSDVATLFRALVQLATQRLRITTAYFVPDEDLTERLAAAADRGVDVQILVPGPHADKRFVQIAGESTFAHLLDHGIRIAAFQPSMLHAKILTVDRAIATIGSANFNARSASLDDEINLVVIEAGLVAQLDEQFEADLARSVDLDPSRWEHRPLLQRALERVIAPLRPVS